MDPFQALAKLPQLIADYERVAHQLAETQKQLAAQQDDEFVTWDWICDHFKVTRPTAMAMLAEEKLFVYGRQIKRFKKSAILRFAERNSIKLKDLPA